MRAVFIIIGLVCIIYLTEAAPEITVNPASPLKVLTVLTLNCTGGTATSNSVYSWTKGTNVIADQTSQTFSKTVTLGDAGSYKCKINNSGTVEESNTVAVIVYEFKDLVATITPVGDVFEGDNFNISCSVTSTPAVTLWTIIDSTSGVTDLVTDSASSFFTTSVVNPTTRKYQCKTKNTYVTAQTSPEVTVIVKTLFTTPTITFAPVVNSADSGTSVNINCNTVINNAGATASYEILKGNLVISNAKSKNCQNLKTTNTGQYSCKVTVNGVVKTSSTKTLTVNLIAQVTTSSKEEGETVLFSCSVKGGEDIASYAWTYDGQPNLSSTSSSLSLTGLNRGALGKIVTCQAKTVVNVLSDVATSSVAIHWLDVPIIKNAEKDFNPIEEKSYSISCYVVSSNPAVTSYQWFKDNVAIDGATSQMYTFQTKRTLTGSYTCEARVVLATSLVNISKTSTPVKVNVLFLDTPTLSVNANQLTASVNISETFTLQCATITNGFNPVSLNHITYTILNSTGGVVSTSNSYTKVATQSDAQTYSCIVKINQPNPLDNGKETELSASSRNLVLTVNFPPTAVQLSPNTSPRKIKVGLNVDVTCFTQSLGIPKSTLQFFKGNSPNEIPNLVPLNEGRNLLLQFASVTQDSTDNYTCKVKNILGEYSVVLQFIVQDRPSKPQDLKVVSTGSTFVVIEWKPPSFDGNDDIINYNVKYGVDIANNNFTERNVTVLTANLTNLMPAVKYYIEVRANNNIFASGNPAATLVTITGESVPTQPRNFSADHNKEQQKLRLSWKIPNPTNGNITNYRVCHQVANLAASTVECQVLPATNLTYDIVKLGKYTPYNVSVEAQTQAGFGEKATLFNIFTYEAKPDQVRNAVVLTVKQSRVLIVKWDTPTNLFGLLKEYKVEISPNINQKNYTSRCINNNNLQCSIDGLLPDTAYSIKITVTNTEGFSSAEFMFDVKTAREAPPPFTGKLPSPTSEGIEEESFKVKLVKFDERFGAIREYIVCVIPLSAGDQTKKEPSSYSNDDIAANKDGIYVAVRKPGAPAANEDFTIGSAPSKRKRRALSFSANNKALEADTFYTVFIRVYVTDDVYQSTPWYDVVKTKEAGGIGGGAIAGIIIAFILLLVVILVLIYLLIRKRKKDPTGTEFVKRGPSKSKIGRTLSAGGIENNNIPVAANRFEDHTFQLRANGNYGFAQEYSSISRDLRFTYSASRLQENNIKNRYHNVPAYDSSRVPLSVLDNDPNSDYINANYIEGFESKKEYIATQGPLPETVFDFWRMVWETDSTTVVMLTKLEEKGRAKCAQYWPDTGSLSLKDIVITATEVHDFPDHTVRSFHMTRTGQAVERVVKQFHFTAWPDFGVPDDPSSILSFIRKVNNWKSTSLGPLIIHCSAGVGRTGTYITIDTQIKNIKKKNDIEVYQNVSSIREQRCLMVQTEDQYIFIHNAIVDYLESGDTEVDANDLREYIKKQSQVDSKTGITGLMEEFIRLAKTDKKDKYQEANRNCNQVKNRYKNVYPYDDTRVRLSPRPGVEGSDYINANYIDSYMCKDNFIATQAPLEGTIGDFWRMIWEQNCGTIVMLSKEVEGGQHKVYPYWPQKKSSKVECFIIELTAVTTFSDYVVREMKLTNTETSSSREVKQFQYTTWPEVSSPDYGVGIIELIGQVQKWNSSINNKIITVHCSAGVGRTGVFIALTNLIERVKTEAVVDVYQAIKKMRQQRTAMVQTRDQYEFCYRALQEYLDSFDLYANFR